MLLDLVTPGRRLTLVGGKGGVGKTTTAAALALSLAERGREVLVLSVDPAHSLGDALGMPLGPEPRAVPGAPGVLAMEVDAEHERARFLGESRGALLRILERGTYLDREDAGALVEQTAPGVDEVAALLRLLELTAGDRPLVVDTAPTGHALRLLDLPRVARGWLAALRAMEAKHRAVAEALVGAYPGDEASRFLDRMDADLARLAALLRSPGETRFILVTTPEPVVVAESRRYAAELTARGIALGGLVVNRSGAVARSGEAGGSVAYVPGLDADLRGPGGLRRFAAAARSTPPESGVAPAAAAPGLRVLGPWNPPADRSLYLVGGKGGVGKSTTAAALALRLAEARGGGVLLLGTDPAGSLGEVLDAPVGASPAPVPGAPGVWVQQVDAGTGWESFRARYREEVERLFGGLLGGGGAATEDRRVVERLVDLAPPGIDELVALLEVVDASADRAYDAVVLDTAPTGHLLRLLQLPDLALEWTHLVLRLLLKYREVVGLGELADRVLRLSQSLRALRDRLRDPAATWTLAVALPESLSVPETRRLLAGLGGVSMAAGTLLINRLLDPSGAPAPRAAAEVGALLEAAGPLPCVAAPELAAPPVGVEALRRLAAGWRVVVAAG